MPESPVSPRLGFVFGSFRAAPWITLCLVATLTLPSLAALGLVTPAAAQEAEREAEKEKSESSSNAVVYRLLQLMAPQHRNEVLDLVRREWQPEFTPMILEIIHLNRDRGFNKRLFDLLRRQTGEDHGKNIEDWFVWLWSQEPRLHPLYPEFKGALYSLVDPLFRGYFAGDRPTTIRLDEVRWGGVKQDGIPPLRNPKMIPANEADYLDDSNVVFGLVVNGDVRAYPKRILAWHEMFVDEVGGEPVTGVYCTLCGSMILYRSTIGDTVHEFGTSGFLYRSNKLMDDRATQSLWNTLWGTPVVGPLVEEDLELERLSVVTTTWGEWRRRHPETLVLSLDTGYKRNYSEGAAYREYFADDELMFKVPEDDNRLRNKAEILGLVFEDETVAISSSFLSKNHLYQDQSGGLRFVVLTDASGAHRAYESGDVTFVEWDGDRSVTDSEGVAWTLSEKALTAPDERSLPRLPSHNAFWFGWHAAYPETRLVK